GGVGGRAGPGGGVRGARLSELARGRRKYGGSIEAALEQRERAAAELAGRAGSDERLAKLEREREAERDRLSRAAARLTHERARAAKALGDAAATAMQSLALGAARFAVELVPVARPEGLPCA